MKKTERIGINSTPVSFKHFLFFLPIIGLFLIEFNLNNDFYFLYPMGEYIVNNGFPVKDFLSMHSGMNIVIQQWLCDVLFYFLYLKFGEIGIYAYMCFCYLIICYFILKLCRIICNNDFIAAFCALTADCLIAYFFMMTRPQVFSFIILLVEVYLLEKYVATKNIKSLLFLPLLSVALVNFHASMWLLFFIFALPYAAEAIPVKLGKFRQEACCSFWALLITGVICFAVGFLNPYGIKNMFYGLISFGKPELHLLVNEMHTTSLKTTVGIVFYCVMVLTIAIFLIKKKKEIKLRFFLLFTGTAILAFTNEKSVAFFFLLAIPAFTYAIKDIEPKISVNQKQNNTFSSAFFCLIIVFFCVITTFSNTTLPTGKLIFPDTKEYDSFDVITDELSKENKSDIIIFSTIDSGPNLEFKGYHPYIDCRMELFFKDNNKEYDYFKEYIDAEYGKIDYLEFINKYHFTHLLLTKNDLNLYEKAKNDDNFELICSVKTSEQEAERYLFKRK